jgi:hypothetical protein
VARQVRPFLPTWQDKRYVKELKRQSPRDRKAIEKDLAELLATLRGAADLATDPDLARFKPTAYRYRGVPQLRSPGAQLYEYRLHGLTRVIVCHFVSHPAVGGEELVLLLAMTVSHDHERLVRLIREHRSSFDDQR